MCRHLETPFIEVGKANIKKLYLWVFFVSIRLDVSLDGWLVTG